jgi:dihydroorotate dehydrogenase electron transfer subunit
MTSLPQPAHVVSITAENETVRTLEFDARMEAEPGQFVMAWLPGVDEKPFSLVCADPVTLTIARVGPFTAAAHTLELGDRLWLRGPLGRPFRIAPSQSAHPTRILLVAGGYGAAPLCFLAERAVALRHAVTVVSGAQTSREVLFAQRFASLGTRVLVTTEDGSLGIQGLATDAVTALLDEASFQCIYACGPEPMLEALEKLARNHSLPAQLSHERYMRCGFGVCGSCARGDWLVCRDGPVRFITAQEGARQPPL